MQITLSNFEQFKNKILTCEAYPDKKIKLLDIFHDPFENEYNFSTLALVSNLRFSELSSTVWYILDSDDYRVFSDDPRFFENDSLTFKLSASIKELSNNENNKINIDPNFKHKCCEKQDIIKSAIDGKNWCRNCGWKEK
jgi:hypothetical protein